VHHDLVEPQALDLVEQRPLVADAQKLGLVDEPFRPRLDAPCARRGVRGA